MNKDPAEQDILDNEREKALVIVQRILELPMNLLAAVWLLLTLLEFTRGLSRSLMLTVNIIWILFWVDFLIKLALAPRKRIFLRNNWLTLLALVVPALRLIRGIRLLSMLRGTRLIKVLGTFNRGMNALSNSMGKRGVGYILGLTVIVILLGGAAILAFENPSSSYIKDYGTGIWWSSMMVTTMGTDYFPKSSEGRLLSFLLALYGFTIFGYLTATVASYFVDKDASRDTKHATEFRMLRDEIEELKELLISLKNK